ncbi:glycosyltransferase [uncultured Flavobacterium sp.]|uniref:glycosyltransferase family 2 protein n=1 Tax=uncultured Flavobacterium sp. TaxID=165435 RepID=UPI0025F06AAC|nr:glycosyltransferase [uncultured Flavobacterium sp.]
MPLISIIIPLYNKEKFIANTLKSVLSQTFSDFEVLIIDDGSTDKSAKIVNEFNDKRIQFISKENKGVSATRNLGIKKATGKYITFLDADDIWKIDFLEEMTSLIASFPEQKVFSAAIEIEIGERIFPAEYSISKDENPQIINYFEGSLLHTAICTCSAIFEKSVFETAGNFDISLKTEEDIDLWIRIGLQYPIVFTWKIGVCYVHDEKGLSSLKNTALKTDFSKYSELAKTNLELEKFLDMNRYSFALKSKLAGEIHGFENFKNKINLKNLNSKQRFLLSLPSFALRKLFAFKLFLQKKNIRLSAFK